MTLKKILLKYNIKKPKQRGIGLLFSIFILNFLCSFAPVKDGYNLKDFGAKGDGKATIRDVVNSPIFLRLGARMRGPKIVSFCTLRRINISNIVVYNNDSHFASLISCVEGQDIENLRLSNNSICYKPLDSAYNKIQQVVSEYEKVYPEPEKFGVLLAYGFYDRHLKAIEMNNINIHFLGEEIRPAFIFYQVSGIKMQNISAQKAASAPLFTLQKSGRFSIHNSMPLKDLQIYDTTTDLY